MCLLFCGPACCAAMHSSDAACSSPSIVRRQAAKDIKQVKPPEGPPKPEPPAKQP